VLLGAGTVLDPESARLAILAGARFIISPSVNVETIRLCNRYQVAAMPGALTPAEIMLALEAGADIVKVFPAEAFGADYIKALRAPLPQAPLMPTGGVTLENLGQWFENGSVAVGIGGSLTKPAASGDYAAVSRIAAEFVARMAQVRGTSKSRAA
jgi:2-dehydro-3-deoxyphosphogluconate aldolase/(4S)-4-hydroxy-2-oxoglutarate aldolase